MTMSLPMKLKHTQLDIQELEKKQNKIYEATLKALGIKQDDPKADWVFDYLFNKFGSATEVLKKCNVDTAIKK